MGGYGDFDHMSISILKELKKKYLYIEIILVLAYLPIKKRLEYETNLMTIYPDKLETIPKKFAITYRNRWIVEKSGYLIAYVHADYGGAYEGLQYAKRKTDCQFSRLEKCKTKGL